MNASRLTETTGLVTAIHSHNGAGRRVPKPCARTMDEYNAPKAFISGDFGTIGAYG